MARDAIISARGSRPPSPPNLDSATCNIAAMEDAFEAGRRSRQAVKGVCAGIKPGERVDVDLSGMMAGIQVSVNKAGRYEAERAAILETPRGWDTTPCRVPPKDRGFIGVHHYNFEGDQHHFLRWVDDFHKQKFNNPEGAMWVSPTQIFEGVRLNASGRDYYRFLDSMTSWVGETGPYITRRSDQEQRNLWFTSEDYLKFYKAGVLAILGLNPKTGDSTPYTYKRLGHAVELTDNQVMTHDPRFCYTPVQLPLRTGEHRRHLWTLHTFNEEDLHRLWHRDIEAEGEPARNRMHHMIRDDVKAFASPECYQRWSTYVAGHLQDDPRQAFWAAAHAINGRDPRTGARGEL